MQLEYIISMRVITKEITFGLTSPSQAIGFNVIDSKPAPIPINTMLHINNGTRQGYRFKTKNT